MAVGASNIIKSDSSYRTLNNLCFLAKYIFIIKMSFFSRDYF